MLSAGDRESYALAVMDEVRRWPGVELRPHASAVTPGEADGIELGRGRRQQIACSSCR